MKKSLKTFLIKHMSLVGSFAVLALTVVIISTAESDASLFNSLVNLVAAYLAGRGSRQTEHPRGGDHHDGG
ncbi:hypothetical protein [Cryptosporangium aurantiacum]|uniref:Uncharacterized protein n=1 Tax=Cryptosporangium aurantiacum TaxID=134849 RepID=A0A1M7R1Y4_9ACTN|nr:hypothetical protein [Cryptosporangium aurantiacum]SHN38661.1 hypothetical protein SAMN05443668_106114 [Cryptosporangium aurantiacum]